MKEATMAERNRNTARPAEWPVDEGASRHEAGDTLEGLDDAQVMELVSNACWTLWERFFSTDGAGASSSSAAAAG